MSDALENDAYFDGVLAERERCARFLEERADYIVKRGDRGNTGSIMAMIYRDEARFIRTGLTMVEAVRKFYPSFDRIPNDVEGPSKDGTS